MSITPLQAAYELCKLSKWTLSNLRIQKILYLAHMVYLGQHKEPLINENETFEASMFGPILPKLFNQMKIFGSNPIHKYFFTLIESIQDKKESLALKNAWENLKNKKGDELIALTHRDNGAWAKVYDTTMNKTITNQSILEEYEQLQIVPSGIISHDSA
jgi:uncharacterized phage-associated protein